MRATTYNGQEVFLPQLLPVTTTRVVLVPDAAELAVLLATGRIEPEDFTHGPSWQDTLADVGSFWMVDFQPYRVSTALAWRRGIPAAFWLEDDPHDDLWDADFYLAAIRTVAIDRLGPRRPEVHDPDEAEACRDLALGSLPILTRLAEARSATAAVEADEALDFDAPELLAAYALEDRLDAEYFRYHDSVEVDLGRSVVAFGPAATFNRLLQALRSDNRTPVGGS